MDYFCSWSGGKDSCLALHRAMKRWGPPQCLFSMLSEDAEHSRSHGIPRRILQAQAQAMGLPIRLGVASWDDYESVFVGQLREFGDQGLRAGVFGDIDLQEHRDWEEKVCAEANMATLLPLWRENHRGLLDEFIGEGFKALIVTVNTDMAPPSLLGQTLDHDLVSQLAQDGIDVSGEAGEFHTLVTDGPDFAEEVDYAVVGHRRIDQYAVLQLR